MEGMQYIQHRVIDGVYQAVLYWKVENGIVFIKEPTGWKETTVPVKFVKDFEVTTPGTDLQSLDSEVNSRKAEAQSGAGEKGRL